MIAILTTSYPRSQSDDAGVFVARLAESLAKVGQPITVVVPRDSTEPERAVQGGVAIHRYRYTVWGPGRLAFGMGLLPNLRRYPSSILQIPGLVLGMLWSLARLKSVSLVQANWIGSGGVAWIYHLFTGTPYIVTLRGSDVPLVGRVRWLSALILRQAKGVVVVGESLQQELHSYLPNLNHVTCIPNGIEVTQPDPIEGQVIRARYGVPNTAYLLAVGSVIPRKGLERVLQLLAHLPEASLVIAGRTEDPRYLESLHQCARDLGVASRLVLLGAVDPHDIGALLQGAVFFVSGSTYEGRPNALLEAMQGGVPVMVSDIPAHRELIVDGVSGIFIDERGEETVAKMRALLADAELRQKMVLAAQSRVAGSTWEGTAQRYCALMGLPREQ